MKRRNLFLLLSSILLAVFLIADESKALEDIAAINVPLNTDASTTISMDFKNAQLNDVLKIFSQQSGLNFIASDDVASKAVTLYLDKVPVEAALERILTANGLTYELQEGGNIFVVKQLKKPKKEVITRVYRLKYASVPSSKINTTLSSDSSGSGNSSSSGPSSGPATGSGQATSTADILRILQSILTTDGSVTEDPRTNSLIVTDIPLQFPLIEQTITRLDVRVPQVLIEVEMLDVSKTTADLLGVKFGNSPLTFSGPSKSSFFPFNGDNVKDDIPAAVTQDEIANTITPPVAYGYTVGQLSFQGLTLTLQFLRTQTDTKNLARPRILTLDNQTAEIKIVTDEAIGLASNTTSTGGTTATTIAQAERAQTGISLKVTPQVNLKTNEITMAIEPKVRQAKAGGTFGSQTFKDPEERGSKSILRVVDGETIVLGGLLRNDDTETKTQVPVLSKIPVLGAAFRHKDKSQNQRELIIFISPHIVRENPAPTKPEDLVNIVREQDVPANRLIEINKELSNIENQRF